MPYADSRSQIGHDDGCICPMFAEYFGNYLLYSVFMVTMEILYVNFVSHFLFCAARKIGAFGSSAWISN